MFTRLAKVFSRTKAPSALVILSGEPLDSVFHCVPEDGYIEHISTSNRVNPFRRGGAVEQSREQIGTLRQRAGEGWVLTSIFQNELDPKVRKLWTETFGREPQLDPQQAKVFARADIVDVARLVDDVLRPAMLEVISEREGRDELADGRIFTVYIVRVNRSRLGLIFGTEPKSIAS